MWSLHSMQYQNPINQIRVRFGKCTYVSLLNVNSPLVKSLKFKGFDMISASYCWNHLADIVTRQGYCKTVWQAWENKLDGCSDGLSQLAWLELDSESVKLSCCIRIPMLQNISIFHKKSHSHRFVLKTAMWILNVSKLYRLELVDAWLNSTQCVFIGLDSAQLDSFHRPPHLLLLLKRFYVYKPAVWKKEKNQQK